MLAALIATRQTVSILTTALPPGSVGIPYSALLLGTGGFMPYMWAVIAGSLPLGLTLNPSTGSISGTPTTAGIFTFTIQLTDAHGETASRVFTITIVVTLYGNQFVAATTTFACIFLVKRALFFAVKPIDPVTSSILHSAIGQLSRLYDQLRDQQASNANQYTLNGALNNPPYLSNLIAAVITIAIPLNLAIQALSVTSPNGVALQEVQRKMSLALRILQSLAIPITLDFT